PTSDQRTRRAASGATTTITRRKTGARSGRTAISATRSSSRTDYAGAPSRIRRRDAYDAVRAVPRASDRRDVLGPEPVPRADPVGDHRHGDGVAVVPASRDVARTATWARRRADHDSRPA